MATIAVDSALTTRAAVKVYLNVGQDTANDARNTQIDALIERWSAAISTFCGRKFAQATYTEYYDGNGTPHLWLNAWPITTPFTGSQAIYEDSSAKFGAGTVLVEDTPSSSTPGDYRIREGEASQGRVSRVAGVWPKGYGNIKAIYQGGYATIPAPIVQAVHRLIARDFTIAEKRLHAVSSESANQGGSLTVVEHDIPKDVKAILAPYRAMRIYG